MSLRPAPLASFKHFYENQIQQLEVQKQTLIDKKKQIAVSLDYDRNPFGKKKVKISTANGSPREN